MSNDWKNPAKSGDYEKAYESSKPEVARIFQTENLVEILYNSYINAREITRYTASALLESVFDEKDHIQKA
jgi:hypothetical protein